jgi:hypothetical protein
VRLTLLRAKAQWPRARPGAIALRPTRSVPPTLLARADEVIARAATRLANLPCRSDAPRGHHSRTCSQRRAHDVPIERFPPLSVCSFHRPRHKPFLLLWIGDVEFFDPLPDRAFRIRRLDAAKDGGRRSFDAANFPSAQFGRLLHDWPRAISALLARTSPRFRQRKSAISSAGQPAVRQYRRSWRSSTDQGLPVLIFGASAGGFLRRYDM